MDLKEDQKRTSEAAEGDWVALLTVAGEPRPSLRRTTARATRLRLLIGEVIVNLKILGEIVALDKTDLCPNQGAGADAELRYG